MSSYNKVSEGNLVVKFPLLYFNVGLFLETITLYLDSKREPG